MKTLKGIYYWSTYKEAFNFARENNFSTDRIIYYKLGWAIQLYVSGPYVGLLNLMR